MATVLNDNEAFKITLQIVEDFISGDYDAFIENGPTDDIKLITWKMEIYFKKLEGKKNSIVEYYMIPIYKLIEQIFYIRSTIPDGQSTSIFNHNVDIIEKSGHHNVIDALTLDFEKNILTKTITIKFICNETYKFSCIKYQSNETQNKLYNYLYQIRLAIIIVLYYYTSSYRTSYLVHDYYILKDLVITDKRINLEDDNNVSWLKDIVKTHYQEILKNIEAYVLYCKTEKIDIDFKKIVDRITYIKEYVKENYDITLV